MKLISVALNEAQRPESDLIAVADKRYPDSCQWITDNATFQEWLDTESLDDLGPNLDPLQTLTDTYPCRVLWVNGPPGSGKSVVAGHVIRYLESLNQDCAYYFFKGSTKTSVAQLLFSLALQVAETNFEARQMFPSLISDGELVRSEEHNVIWNNLFLGRLLKIPFPQPQYWVIDALDEFTRIDSAVPLKILKWQRGANPGPGETPEV